MNDNDGNFQLIISMNSPQLIKLTVTYSSDVDFMGMSHGCPIMNMD